MKKQNFLHKGWAYRSVSIMLIFALIAGCFSACGTAAPQASAAESAAKADAVQKYLETGEITDQPVTLRWLHRFPSEEEAAYFQSLADEYTQMHPNVTFQIDTASDDAMKEKLRVMVGGGDVPDIYYS